jgi:hypothetical protein
MLSMPPHRTVALLVLILAGLGLFAAGCGDAEERAPVVVPSDVHLAAAGPPLATAAPPAARDDGGRLEAARTVALYCHLIDQSQFARAGALCSRRRLWSRRAFASLRGLRFRSARVFAAPDARTLVLAVRVRVHAGRGCPLPDGLTTLFFTLGRVGSAVGGWLITAVSTSP